MPQASQDVEFDQLNAVLQGFAPEIGHSDSPNAAEPEWVLAGVYGDMPPLYSVLSCICAGRTSY